MAACVLAVALAGCGGGSHKTTSHSNTTAATSTSTTGGTAKPVASGYYTAPWINGPNSYKVSIYDLRRDGPFLTLDFKGTCVSQGCTDGFSAFAFDFYEGEGTFDATSLAGIRLLDPVNNKVYRVVQDAAGDDWESKLDISLQGSPS